MLRHLQHTRTEKFILVFRAHKVHVHAKCIVTFMILTKLTHTHTGRASLISQHVARTLEILRNQLLHHQFQQAAATMETVAMVMDHVPEIVRKVEISVIMSVDVYVRIVTGLVATFQPSSLSLAIKQKHKLKVKVKETFFCMQPGYKATTQLSLKAQTVCLRLWRVPFLNMQSSSSQI